MSRRSWRLGRSRRSGGFRWYFGIDLERQHVGAVVRRVIKTDNSKVRRIP